MERRGTARLCRVLRLINIAGVMNVPTIQHSLATAELDYELPQGLIATKPAEPRDSARLMVVRRSSDEIEHVHVRDLPGFLRAGDALVFNTTAVIPARLVGERQSTSGKVEGLFLHEVPSSDGVMRWQVMLHTGGKLHSGDRIALRAEHGDAACVMELQEKIGAEWIVRVPESADTTQVLKAVGRTPLPPYILKARGGNAIEDARDRAWYQTVYAHQNEQKSVAAPTAGLHFTPGVLQAIAEKEVQRIDVALHVGPGTFKPVTVATLAEHQMHFEEYEVSAKAIDALRRVRNDRGRTAGGRIISVGTTTVRTLESLDWKSLDGAAKLHDVPAVRGSTDLLIAPPYKFQCVDGMLTNFHLPRSTLLALVAAMVGLDRLKAIYREAIDKGYRFYSYGDAMLVLP